MERILPSAIAVLLATVLQAGLAPHITVFGAVPNLLLLVVVTIALSTGSNEGATVGFMAGLAFDLVGAGPVGAMALVLTIAGYAAGMLHTAMFAEGWLLPLTVLAITAIAVEISYGLLLGLLGTDVPFWRTLFTKMLPGAVYNTTLALLVYPWLARFLRHDRPMKTFRRLA
jgi:rod shape-determining protein MreD